MRPISLVRAVVLLALACPIAQNAMADGNPDRVMHIVVIMQENHSFDNYFGALAYAPGSPYHPGHGWCREDDHRCVDGLSCSFGAGGTLSCNNSNPDEDGSIVHSFHDPTRCTVPDLNHTWYWTHRELNYFEPNDSLFDQDHNGFVLVNDATEQLDNGVESPTEDETMGYYNQDDIPFYYSLAANFAVNDHYFASVLGPTFPNRSYLMAATSFGHVTTSDQAPPTVDGYKPITGTIFDLLDAHHVTWADYYQDVPQGGSFRPFSATLVDPHFLPLTILLAQVSGAPGLPELPSVSFVDPDFGALGIENDEHPPTDIQRGQAYVSRVISAIRNGPYWKDTVIFLTYDEHGGYYDHADSPRARQGGARTPDGIAPGQCADLSNPPASEQPGGGAECSSNPGSTTDTSTNDTAQLCPEFASNPTGPFPENCASFDQVGVRVPFLAISPFSKPHYVSHAIGDHTSILAFIEMRFLREVRFGDRDDGDDVRSRPLHLTRRDEYANTLEEMFDFDRSPSARVPITPVAGPAVDCTPTGAPARSAP